MREDEEEEERQTGKMEKSVERNRRYNKDESRR